LKEIAMTNAPQSAEKLPRFRSGAYPSVPLSKAIERAAALYAKALHHSVPVAVVASAWEYGEKSSGLFATVAALKQYGLLSDDQIGEKRRFRLTDAAVRIVRDPDPNSEKRKSAIQTAALSPKIYSVLWDKYGAAGASGAMDVILKTYLTLDRKDDGEAPYSDSSADELISHYRATVTFAGLVESPSVSSETDYSQGNANLGMPEGSEPMIVEPQKILPTSVGERLAPSPPKAQVELNDINVQISGGKVRIDALLDLEGLVKLESKIQLLKSLLN
jgi:hypothetical protein